MSTVIDLTDTPDNESHRASSMATGSSRSSLLSGVGHLGIFSTETSSGSRLEVIDLLDDESSSERTPQAPATKKSRVLDVNDVIDLCDESREPKRSKITPPQANPQCLPNHFVARRSTSDGSWSRPITSRLDQADDLDTIYNDARRPVKLLQQQILEIQSEISVCGYEVDSNEWIDAQDQKQRLQEQLAHAQQNARDSVYSLVNYNQNCIADSTTRQAFDRDGIPLVDLHGLHVKEALEVFDATVKPVLESLKTMTLITGWGKHSRNGKGVLQEAVKEYIESSDNMKWVPVSGNPGRLRVCWTKEQSNTQT